MVRKKNATGMHFPFYIRYQPPHILTMKVCSDIKRAKLSGAPPGASATGCRSINHPTSTAKGRVHFPFDVYPLSRHCFTVRACFSKIRLQVSGAAEAVPAQSNRRIDRFSKSPAERQAHFDFDNHPLSTHYLKMRICVEMKSEMERRLSGGASQCSKTFVPDPIPPEKARPKEFPRLQTRGPGTVNATIKVSY